MRRVLMSVGCLLFITCKEHGYEPGGLVTVNIEEGLLSKCAVVEITAPNQNTVKSVGQSIVGKTSIAVGIAQKAFPASVDVRAVGYDSDCATLTSPIEMSEPVQLTFASPPAQVTLTLKANAVRIDADLDGVPVPEDCNDADETIFPLAVENCADGKNNNCDDKTDCDDTTCPGRACVLGVGSALAACGAGGCRELNCANGVDDNRDGNTDCADPTCAGQACPLNGTCTNLACTGADTENGPGLCADGIDNDGDAKTDCADPDCNNQDCSDQKACTAGDKCVNAACVSGAVSCTTPPGVCFATTGGCGAGNLCSYAALPSASNCSDGLNCTDSDHCDGDGGCTGTPRSCPPSGDQCRLAGVCLESDGGCEYPIAVNQSCSDGDSCTVGDSCSPAGQCLGTGVTCPAAAECSMRAGCIADGGCSYILSPLESPCDGGFCDGMGTCQPMVVPSNISIAQAIGADGGSINLTNNCTVRIDTGEQGAAMPSVASTSGCNFTLPSFSFADQSEGPQLMVLSLQNFTIGPNATLEIFGRRGFVIAAKGDITINGRLFAGALQVGSTWRDGPGGNSDAHCGIGNERGGNVAATEHGGGGGGAFTTAGGRGGNPGSNFPGESGAASGVAGSQPPTLVPLRGGCEGGRGGNWSTEVNIGRAGGAIQLISQNNLNVTGIIAVPGNGGSGSENGSHGGGGGGSGGGILLEARAVAIGASARLTANGGGGGSGSGNQRGNAGAMGSVNSATPASGGSGPTTAGGSGGAGAAGTTAAVTGSDAQANNGAGGGGGGGAGRIRINSLGACNVDNAAVFSPPRSGCP